MFQSPRDAQAGLAQEDFFDTLHSHSGRGGVGFDIRTAEKMLSHEELVTFKGGANCDGNWYVCTSNMQNAENECEEPLLLDYLGIEEDGNGSYRVKE